MAVMGDDAALPLHGGDLTAAEARWGTSSDGWLDLSTGINPWPYPLPAIPAAAWTRLPSAADQALLAAAAARRYRLRHGVVLAAAGSQALIQAAPRLLPPGPVVVVGPTYGEHARAWAAAGHHVVHRTDAADIGDAAAAVVVNPNNPDGRIVPPALLRDLADRFALRGGLLVVDEAFADSRPDLSLVPDLGPGLVVLRSFGKFYGLAGLRLGFALAMPELADRLAALLGPWPASGPALAVGMRALADEDWAAATVARLDAAAAALDGVLMRAGLEVVGGTNLFRLAESRRAPDLYERLGRAGILVRAFADRPTLLRIGLPGDAPALARLERALPL
jgi:cobalamin biosynthesis protein CobC